MIARRLAAFAVALLLAAPAFAQDEPPPLPPPESPPPAVEPPPAAAPAAADALKKFAKKGVIEVEGGIGFSYQKGGFYDFALAPAGRYFIIDGLSVGLRLEVGYSKYGDTTGSFTTTSFGLVPMAEYNLDLGSRLFPYGGLGFGYGYSKVSAGGFDSSGQSYGLMEPGAGVKMVFGHGGVVGVGLEFPVSFYDGGTSWAFRILTRYGIFF